MLYKEDVQAMISEELKQDKINALKISALCQACSCLEYMPKSSCSSTSICAPIDGASFEDQFKSKLHAAIQERLKFFGLKEDLNLTSTSAEDFYRFVLPMPDSRMEVDFRSLLASSESFTRSDCFKSMMKSHYSFKVVSLKILSETTEFGSKKWIKGVLLFGKPALPTAKEIVDYVKEHGESWLYGA